MKGQATTCSPR